MYKLSEVGQAIEQNDLTSAGSVLGKGKDADWVQKANIALNKVYLVSLCMFGITVTPRFYETRVNSNMHLNAFTVNPFVMKCLITISYQKLDKKESCLLLIS